LLQSILIERLARPDRLSGQHGRIGEAHAAASLFALDGLVAAGEVGGGHLGILLTEFQIEAVGTGVLQQLVAPAVIQHPVGDIFARLVVGHQLLLGIEFGRCRG